MSALRVRVYDVKFGDAILLSIPDGAGFKHVLIDVGNIKGKDGGDDSVFVPVIEDVLRELDGAPLHLYISTHEHLDHVQGLLYTSRRMEKQVPPVDLKAQLKVERVWLTASAAPDYYARFPDAEKQKKLQLNLFKGLTAAHEDGRSLFAARFDAMAANNNPGTTAHCVEYVRSLVRGADGTDGASYVHRGLAVNGLHALPGVDIEILAPEEDATVYYRATPKHRAVLGADRSDDEIEALGKLAGRGLPAAPAGVDASAFRLLWEQFRDGGLEDTLLQIDKAANNTSIVFRLEWQGWKLLFAGDAELRSWDQMDRVGVLSPVHFLKVSHHGSHNGTPAEALLDKVLPPGATGRRWVVVSTCNGAYGGIPHDPTDIKLKQRCTDFHRTTDADLQSGPGGVRFFDLHFGPAEADAAPQQ
jgi:beta-lactamase superfamily II metal-dependent hydrolase